MEKHATDLDSSCSHSETCQTAQDPAVVRLFTLFVGVTLPDTTREHYKSIKMILRERMNNIDL